MGQPHGRGGAVRGRREGVEGFLVTFHFFFFLHSSCPTPHPLTLHRPTLQPRALLPARPRVVGHRPLPSQSARAQVELATQVRTRSSTLLRVLRLVSVLFPHRVPTALSPYSVRQDNDCCTGSFTQWSCLPRVSFPYIERKKGSVRRILERDTVNTPFLQDPSNPLLEGTESGTVSESSP